MQPPKVNAKDLTTAKLFGLEGKVAVITGATDALMSTVAKGLAVNGVDLALTCVEEDALDGLSKEVCALGVKALPAYRVNSFAPCIF